MGKDVDQIVRDLAKTFTPPSLYAVSGAFFTLFSHVSHTHRPQVGFVGKDVDQIVRDLVDAGIAMAKTKAMEKIKEKVSVKYYTTTLYYHYTIILHDHITVLVPWSRRWRRSKRSCESGGIGQCRTGRIWGYMGT